MDEVGHVLRKKATNLEHLAEILITGEQLRLRLHKAKVIKDRRHHLRTYPNCFVARELVDWLLENKDEAERSTALRGMQILMTHNVLHHVCDEHTDFKDAKLLYRFRKDDGTFPLNNEIKVFMRGQRLFDKLNVVESPVLHKNTDGSTAFDRAFLGCDMVDWLVREGEAATREEGTHLCQRLFDHGIIRNSKMCVSEGCQPGTVSADIHSPKDQFLDSNLLYQFRLNYHRRRVFGELLCETPAPPPAGSHESPFSLRKQTPAGSAELSSFSSVSPAKEIAVVRRGSMSNSSAGSSNGYYSASPTLSSSPPILCMPRSVLKRPVSVDELLRPGAPFLKKTLTVIGDAVGWGFVVRGAQPCHIQAVDPSGPAATAGMKVCQFLVSVNGHNVLPLDYRTLSSLILTGPSTIVLEVMEEMV